MRKKFNLIKQHSKVPDGDINIYSNKRASEQSQARARNLRMVTMLVEKGATCDIARYCTCTYTNMVISMAIAASPSCIRQHSCHEIVTSRGIY
jgi:hypothetical protein